MVYGPRAGIGTWLTIGVTAAALSVPLVVLAAPPWLSQPPPPLTIARGEPTRVAPSGRLDAQLIHLPIVVSDLPDAGSQGAAAEYTSLRVQQPPAVQTMFSDTWLNLTVSPSQGDAVSQLGGYLLSTPSTFSFTSEIDSEVDAATVAALPGLISDPRNADRLSNAAVALFDLGVSWDQAFVARDDTTPALWLGTYFELRALELLHEVDTAFPANRAVLLNEAYFTSIRPAGCSVNVANLRSALGPALKWLQRAPDDITARMFVASLQARDAVRIVDSLVPGQNDQPAGLHDALATLAPLVGSSSTASLGHAAIGDAYLAAANSVAGQAPYLARQYAELARLEYDHALALVNDPGLWVGISAALSRVGDNTGAVEAQRTALSLAPDSAELWIGLALDDENVGDFRGMRSAAQRSLTQGLAGANQLFRDARLVASSPGVPTPSDRGYLGYSFGSDQSRTPVYNLISGCGAGGFFTTDVVPAVDDPRIDDAAHFLPLPDAAVLTATAASLVLSDPSTAEADVQKWLGPAASNPAAAADKLWLDRVIQVGAVALQAVHLVTDGSLQPGADLKTVVRFAESHLRHSAYVSGQAPLFARAAAVCRLEAGGAGPFSALDATDRLTGLLCQGESAYHAGDYASASVALQSADAGTEAAVAMWKAGRPDDAHRLLLKVLTGPDPKDLGAQEILGELLLDQGDPRAAIDYFVLTLDSIQQMPLANAGDEFHPTVRLIAEHAYNNYGVALLWRAQRALGAAPDCGSHGSVCQEARDEFAAALSFDPNNPYYLQNAAWSDRLLNHFSASRSELDAAAKADSADYPALNDLGVMAAQTGDLAAAQQAFDSSLRARPDYDLAAWNLGVLGMQQGSFRIAAAQVYFARAIRENPQLRSSPHQFLPDNRIYRAAFGQPLQPSTTATTIQGYSAGAAATGGIAAFSALGDMMGIEFKGKLADLMAGLRLPFLAGLIGRLRLGVLIRRLRFPQRTPAPVRTWLPTVLVLAIGTTWTVWSRQGVAAGAELVLAVLATAIAVLVHECGHLIAACLWRIRIAPAPSPLGITMSALLIPLRLSSGPYAGHRSFPGTPHGRAKWVYLAGPVANLSVAGLALGLYLVQPLPFLLLLTGVQLAAAGFSLMPFEPLDGAALSRNRKEHAAVFALLVAALSLLVGLGGAALVFGII